MPHDAGSLYEFSEEGGDQSRQGLPPIVGSDGGSAWFGGDGHVLAGPVKLAEEPASIYFGVDLQPDSPSEQVVLGTEKSGKTALRLVVNHEGVSDGFRCCCAMKMGDGSRCEQQALVPWLAV